MRVWQTQGHVKWLQDITIISSSHLRVASIRLSLPACQHGARPECHRVGESVVNKCLALPCDCSQQGPSHAFHVQFPSQGRGRDWWCLCKWDQDHTVEQVLDAARQHLALGLHLACGGCMVFEPSAQVRDAICSGLRPEPVVWNRWLVSRQKSWERFPGKLKMKRFRVRLTNCRSLFQSLYRLAVRKLHLWTCLQHMDPSQIDDNDVTSKVCHFLYSYGVDIYIYPCWHYNTHPQNPLSNQIPKQPPHLYLYILPGWYNHKMLLALLVLKQYDVILRSCIIAFVFGRLKDTWSDCKISP